MSIFDEGRPFEGGWLFGEGRPFEEEQQQQQPEKKQLFGEGYEIEIEEPKRLKVEDEDEDEDDDGDEDFYDSDSEEDMGHGFKCYFKVVERTFGDDETTTPDEDEEDRNCLQVRQCNKYQHVSKFDGLPLFELFKVKLRLNHKCSSSSLEGPLYGAIELFPSPENPNPFSYFRASKKDPYSITLNPGKSVSLPLSSPQPRPPIADDYWVELNLAFKFNNEDVFRGGALYENPQLFDDGHGNHEATSRFIGSCPDYIEFRSSFIRRHCFGDPDCDRFIMAAYSSLYFGAWATVHVQILKKGVTGCCGFIYARPCVFYSRIRLLSIQSNQKRELQDSGFVKLTRSVVAVPTYSSLIIAAVLYDQDGKRIVCGKTYFPASPEGRKFKYIDKDGVAILKVTVDWACKP